MKKNLTVVILAAGLGTRMKSRKAKVLHEAGGETLLNHIIRAALHVAEPERIVAVVGHQAAQVRASVKTAGIHFAEQSEQRGTGHAVLCARESVGVQSGQLMILNGDGPLLRSETLTALAGFAAQAGAGGAIVTTYLEDPTGYGRVVRDANGLVAKVVEQKAASPEQLQIRESNPGLYCFDAELFWRHINEVTTNNPANEYYLTDMVEILAGHGQPVAPFPVADQTELLGINTRVELALADKILRARKAQELMLAGVTLENPDSITVDVNVEVGMDSVLEANVQLRGRTSIGAGCRIGTGSILRDCRIEDEVSILPYVVADDAIIGSHASVGPFTRLRPAADIGEDAHIGNFVEIKKTKVGKGAKAGHLTYLGDATIGAGTNIGAGTITCNYDGQKKHQTEIGEGVFVGSNSTLVAPLKLADGAFTAAGSTITRNVEADALAIGRAQQVIKLGWAKRRRRPT
jgi:bifunctional UDP-N-acetylglucosamine pyrophosphorylase / glucosamine-1-phosphate N-acetyltransferase